MNNLSPVQDELAVRVRVTELIDEFFARVDHGESVADLMVEDAVFKTHQRFAEGRQGVADLMLSLFQQRRDKGRAARHLGSNVSVSALGEGRYRVRLLVVVIALDASAGSKGFLNMGDHDDVVAFDADGRCRFVSRTMSPVLQLEIAAPAAA